MSSVETKRWLAKLADLLELGASEQALAAFISAANPGQDSLATSVFVNSLMDTPLYGSRRNPRKKSD
jgi:hypothetical protein